MGFLKYPLEQTSNRYLQLCNLNSFPYVGSSVCFRIFCGKTDHSLNVVSLCMFLSVCVCVCVFAPCRWGLVGVCKCSQLQGKPFAQVRAWASCSVCCWLFVFLGLLLLVYLINATVFRYFAVYVGFWLLLVPKVYNVQISQCLMFPEWLIFIFKSWASEGGGLLPLQLAFPAFSHGFGLQVPKCFGLQDAMPCYIQTFSGKQPVLVNSPQCTSSCWRGDALCLASFGKLPC